MSLEIISIGNDHAVELHDRSTGGVRRAMFKVAGLDGTITMGDNGALSILPDGKTVLMKGNLTATGLFAEGIGAALTVVANTIVPTNMIHHVGAGLIKNITAPAIFTGKVGGSIALIPDAAFTWDTTGNIAPGGALTAVISKVLWLTYDPATSKWYPSY